MLNRAQGYVEDDEYSYRRAVKSNGRPQFHELGEGSQTIAESGEADQDEEDEQEPSVLVGTVMAVGVDDDTGPRLRLCSAPSPEAPGPKSARHVHEPKGRADADRPDGGSAQDAQLTDELKTVVCQVLEHNHVSDRLLAALVRGNTPEPLRQAFGLSFALVLTEAMDELLAEGKITRTGGQDQTWTLAGDEGEAEPAQPWECEP